MLFHVFIFASCKKKKIIIILLSSRLNQDLCWLHTHTHAHSYIYIYIFTKSNIYQYSRYQKKTKKPWPGTRDENISNHRPEEKEKSFLG